MFIDLNCRFVESYHFSNNIHIHGYLGEIAYHLAMEAIEGIAVALEKISILEQTQMNERDRMMAQEKIIGLRNEIGILLRFIEFN